MSDPYLPAVGALYWLQITILPPGDPQVQRAAVVLAAPPTTTGTVAVALRSAGGDFSRRVPVQALLWTAANVTPIGRLDQPTFEAVQTRFGL